MSYAKIRIIGNGVTIPMNVDLHAGKSFYKANTKELLSTLGTRHTETPKQADHGVEDSLSQYGPRFLPFEGEIHARSISERIQMEQNLRKCLSLKRSQSYLDEDGYILLQIEDEDGSEKQCYAKVVEMPEFSWLAEGRLVISRFRFSMLAADPFLYSQTLKEGEGDESTYITQFTLQDGALKALQDGNLPTLQEELAQSLTVTNAGTIGSSPVIIVHGPTDDPVVINKTTGKRMDLSGLSLAQGERVEIEVEPPTITKFDNSEIESDASAYLTADSDWIFIEPGDNDLALLDSTPGDLSGRLEVQFRDCWT